MHGGVSEKNQIHRVASCLLEVLPQMCLTIPTTDRLLPAKVATTQERYTNVCFKSAVFILDNLKKSIVEKNIIFPYQH